MTKEGRQLLGQPLPDAAAQAGRVSFVSSLHQELRKFPASAIASDAHVTASLARKSSVLVADDNEANLELFAGILTAAGYRVVCARTGEQALSSVRNESIDAILLDVVMPGLSGFAVCQKLKLNPETCLIPVVLATGLTNTEDRIHGIMCGADDFLSKPVNKHELLARVHSLLRLKQFTDELDNAETVLFSLALSIEAKDPCTEGHCDRLASHSEALGRRLGLPEEQCVALRRAGVVHDIGKIGVPEH